MRYYNIETQKVVSERQVVKANPNTSFALPFNSQTLQDFGLVKLVEDTKPSYNPETQKIIESAIEVRDGVAYQTYTVIARSADAIANDLSNKKANIRAQRNQRLTETDWAILPDSPLSAEDKIVYQNYRAALRDVPAQEGFPTNALPEGPDQQPYESWSYDSTNFVWNAPLPKPEGEAYWNEDAYQADNTTGWVIL